MLSPSVAIAPSAMESKGSGVLVGLLALFMPLAPAFGADYYVSPTGNDAASGASAISAWKTIDKINTLALKPGDRVLFEGGKTFTGKLLLNERDAGVAGNPVTITSFGTGKAILENPTGSSIEGLVCRYMKINRLILSGAGWNTFNGSRGMNFTWLNDSEIDDVEVKGFHKAGIFLNKAIDVRITNCYVHDNGYAGIFTEGGCDRMYIGYCKALRNFGDPTILNNHSGNGILLTFTANSLVEFCEAAENGAQNQSMDMGPFGIWAANATAITIQHCISHDNKSRAGAPDGGGFDLDGETYDSVLQYNYSYNNNGAGYLLCTWPGSIAARNTVRYNISENDGSGSHSAGIFSVGSARQANMEIHNNTIYNSAGRNGISGDGQVPASFMFRNNVIVLRGNGSFVKDMNSAVFQGNAYWNLDNGGNWAGYASLDAWRTATGKETLNGANVGMNRDPLLANPGFGAKIIDPSLIRTLSAYQLMPGSPCIDRGINLRTTFALPVGNEDFFGTVVPANGAYDPGAHEFTATQPLQPVSFATQPGDRAVTAGQSATFSVTATGTAPLTYQWQRLTGTTWSDIGGATAATYSVTAALSDNGARFRIRVGNGAGTVTSTEATLTVIVNAPPPPPTVTIAPASRAVNAGQSAAFTVTASGIAPLTYQWQRLSGTTWSDIANATTDTYSLTAALGDNGARFRVRVGNGAGTITSAEATLTVTVPVIAPTVTTAPANRAVTAGLSASFSVTATGTAPLTYQWQRLGGTTWSDIANATTDTYSLSAALGDNGARFRVRVGNGAGTITSAEATLIVGSATAVPVIVGQPVGGEVTIGADVMASISARGVPEPTVQWQKSIDGISWNEIPQATAFSYSFTVSGLDPTIHLRAVATNSAGKAFSTAAVFTIDPISKSVASSGADSSENGGCGLGAGMALFLCGAMIAGANLFRNRT